MAHPMTVADAFEAAEYSKDLSFLRKLPRGSVSDVGGSMNTTILHRLCWNPLDDGESVLYLVRELGVE